MSSRRGIPTTDRVPARKKTEYASESIARSHENPAKQSDLPEKIAAKILRFDDPYASKSDQYIVSCNTGEIFYIGRPLRTSRCISGRALKRNVKTFEDFKEFASKQDISNWRFWSLKLPGRKSEISNLADEYDRFNKSINNHFSALRNKNIFEVLLETIHIKYFISDISKKEEFDIHLHMICRVVPEFYDDIFKELNNKFSKVDIKENDYIRNINGCAFYMLKNVLPFEDIATWPSHILETIWNFTLGKPQLVRPCGSFQEWRRARSPRRSLPKLTKEERESHQRATFEARARKKNNRAETAYDGSYDVPDQYLRTVNFRLPDGTWDVGNRYKCAPRSKNEAEPTEGTAAVLSDGSGTHPANLVESSALSTTIQQHPQQLGRRPKPWWGRVWSYGVPRRPAGPIRRRLARCDDQAFSRADRRSNRMAALSLSKIRLRASRHRSQSLDAMSLPPQVASLLDALSQRARALLQQQDPEIGKSREVLTG